MNKIALENYKQQKVEEMAMVKTYFTYKEPYYVEMLKMMEEKKQQKKKYHEKVQTEGFDKLFYPREYKTKEKQQLKNE